MHRKQIKRIITGIYDEMPKTWKNNKVIRCQGRSPYIRLIMRNMFPYEIVKDDKLSDLYVIRNREKKPLGIFGYGWSEDKLVDYKDFPCMIYDELFIKIEKTFRRNGRSSSDAIQFYDDSDAPWYGGKDMERYCLLLRELIDIL
ncbi:hypothetical protein [Providencia manganoxydans]|uniref:hypothetical protein n=1 Tax=Providencia manganoxydans TaxID=2923283 RepID=UPI0034E3A7FF